MWEVSCSLQTKIIHTTFTSNLTATIKYFKGLNNLANFWTESSVDLVHKLGLTQSFRKSYCKSSENTALQNEEGPGNGMEKAWLPSTWKILYLWKQVPVYKADRSPAPQITKNLLNLKKHKFETLKSIYFDLYGLFLRKVSTEKKQLISTKSCLFYFYWYHKIYLNCNLKSYQILLTTRHKFLQKRELQYIQHEIGSFLQ